MYDAGAVIDDYLSRANTPLKSPRGTPRRVQTSRTGLETQIGSCQRRMRSDVSNESWKEDADQIWSGNLFKGRATKAKDKKVH